MNDPFYVKEEKYIDLCREFIEEKDAYYLAKDNNVVYYASDFADGSNPKWVTMSLTQANNIVSTTKSDTPFNQHLLIKAFQELDKVKEYAVDSGEKVAPHILNYRKDFSKDEVVIQFLKILNQTFQVFVVQVFVVPFRNF